MITKFVDELDMKRFIRALPENANYRYMLNQDFSIVAPIDATAKEMESLWKYYVHQQFLKKSADANAETVVAFMDELHRPVVEAKRQVVNEPVMKKSKKPKYVPERKNGCGFKGVLEGAAKVIQEGNRWFGFVGDSVVANSPNRKYVVARLSQRGFSVE